MTFPLQNIRFFRNPESGIRDAYRYGFNGGEKTEIATGLYLIDFRIVDSKAGRWFSTNPVTHTFQSPYNGFDTNPISIYDPSGADGEGDKETGKLKATV